MNVSTNYRNSFAISFWKKRQNYYGSFLFFENIKIGGIIKLVNENKILEEEKISKLLLKFSVPCIIGLLISAFYNKDDILKAYEEAIKERYRFFSFGDAMLII